MPKFQEVQLAPRIVEAIIVTKGNNEELKEFCPAIGMSIDMADFSNTPFQISLKDNKGYVREANVGDWIIKDANGHFTVETFLSFAAMYKVIKEE